MVSHPLTTGALFLVIGMLYERRHTRQIDDFGGIWKSAPMLTALFLIAMFAGIGLPGLLRVRRRVPRRWSARSPSHRWWAVVATTGVILAAVYMLWMFQRVFTGVPEGENATMHDVIAPRDRRRGAAARAVSLFIGLYSKPVIDRVEPTVKCVMRNFEREDRLQAAEAGPGPPPRGRGVNGVRSHDRGRHHHSRRRLVRDRADRHAWSRPAS